MYRVVRELYSSIAHTRLTARTDAGSAASRGGLSYHHDSLRIRHPSRALPGLCSELRRQRNPMESFRVTV